MLERTGRIRSWKDLLTSLSRLSHSVQTVTVKRDKIGGSFFEIRPLMPSTQYTLCPNISKV